MGFLVIKFEFGEVLLALLGANADPSICFTIEFSHRCRFIHSSFEFLFWLTLKVKHFFVHSFSGFLVGIIDVFIFIVKKQLFLRWVILLFVFECSEKGRVNLLYVTFFLFTFRSDKLYLVLLNIWVAYFSFLLVQYHPNLNNISVIFLNDIKT